MSARLFGLRIAKPWVPEVLHTCSSHLLRRCAPTSPDVPKKKCSGFSFSMSTRCKTPLPEDGMQEGKEASKSMHCSPRAMPCASSGPAQHTHRGAMLSCCQGEAHLLSGPILNAFRQKKHTESWTSEEVSIWRELAEQGFYQPPLAGKKPDSQQLTAFPELPISQQRAVITAVTRGWLIAAG